MWAARKDISKDLSKDSCTHDGLAKFTSVRAEIQGPLGVHAGNLGVAAAALSV